MEYVSFVLSIIAIVISVIVAVSEYIRDYKINTINLESSYFKDIYRDHLVYKLPKARKYIDFNMENELIGTDKLIGELQELKKDSIYFLYNRPDFYDTLKHEIQTLENYLVDNADKKFTVKDKNTVYSTLKQSMENIYKIISDGYLGK